MTAPVDLDAVDAMMERVARAWASIDGKADRFEVCKMDPTLDHTDGSYSGYLEDAKELLFLSGLAHTIAALEARVEALTGALQWCSGSSDFNEGGQAREGWLRICAPLLKGETP